jgi:hypothetical protein
MNTAQHVLMKMGVDPSLLFLDRSQAGYSPSFTKKGPGRKHSYKGVKK